MRLALGQPLPSSVAAPDEPSDLSTPRDHAKGATDDLQALYRCFAKRHHVGASAWAGQVPGAASALDIPISPPPQQR